MLFRPSLSLLSTQFVEDVNSPAEWVVVALVPIELVQSLEFGIGNNEI